jgi:hypothetical protein
MNTDQVTTRSVAEIEAELKAARDAEAKRKEEQQRELALARKREELALTDGYMQKLQEAMVAQGVECSVYVGRVGEHGSTRFATLVYPEDSDAFAANAQPRIERRSGGYSSPDSYQIQFGGYGERKTYPRLKDGTFKYEKIASELAAHIQHKLAQRQQRQQQEQAYKASRVLEDQLEKEFPDCAGYIRATTNPDAATIKFEQALTMEQAREVLTAIQKVMRQAGRETTLTL